MTTRILACCAILTTCILVGCGGGGGDGASVLSLKEVKVEEDRAAKKTLDETGGSVTATGSNGTVYTLTIPPGALLEETEIGLYPIASLNKALFAKGIRAGVHFTPDGLQLLQPATLTMQFKEPIDAATFTGFGYYGDLDEPHAKPVTINGATVTMSILHFSGAGGAFGDIQWPSEPLRMESVADRLITTILRNHPTPTNAQWQLIADLFASWYDQHFAGKLALLATYPWNQEWLMVIDFLDWKAMVDQYPLARQKILARYNQGLADLVTGVKQAIGGQNFDCLDTSKTPTVQDAIKDGGPVRHILALRVMAETVIGASSAVANGLDLRTVLSQLCVEIKLDTQFPQTLAAGSTGALQVKGGYALKSKPSDIEYEASMAVTVLVRGATDNSTQTGTINRPNGRDPYVHSWTRAGESNPLNLLVSVKPVTPSTLRFMLAEKAIVAGGSGDPRPVELEGVYRGMATGDGRSQRGEWDFTKKSDGTYRFDWYDLVGDNNDQRSFFPRVTIPSVTWIQSKYDGTTPNGVIHLSGRIGSGTVTYNTNPSVTYEFVFD